MAFGMDLKDFSSMFESSYTLFLVILGEFDFEGIRNANDIVGCVHTCIQTAAPVACLG